MTDSVFAPRRSTENGEKQFSIEWYTSDTTVSIDYLRKGVVDVGITYHAVAEHTALEEKIVDRVEYVWRDHWMLVGPKGNPARLPTDQKSSVFKLLTKLFSAMEGAKDSEKPIKFLSRCVLLVPHIFVRIIAFLHLLYQKHILKYF